MPTYIYNKKDFLEFIDKQVGDDEVIVFTNELIGNISMSKKSGIKLTHQYANDTFLDEGIGHIAFGKSHPLGMIIAKQERLSNKAKEAMGNIRNH